MLFSAEREIKQSIIANTIHEIQIMYTPVGRSAPTVSVLIHPLTNLIMFIMTCITGHLSITTANQIAKLSAAIFTHISIIIILDYGIRILYRMVHPLPPSLPSFFHFFFDIFDIAKEKKIG